jgi:hypothetical protein
VRKCLIAARLLAVLLACFVTPVSRADVAIVPRGENFILRTGSVDEGMIGGRPAIAHDGANFLVVWRRGPTSSWPPT